MAQNQKEKPQHLEERTEDLIGPQNFEENLPNLEEITVLIDVTPNPKRKLQSMEEKSQFSGERSQSPGRKVPIVKRKMQREKLPNMEEITILDEITILEDITILEEITTVEEITIPEEKTIQEEITIMEEIKPNFKRRLQSMENKFQSQDEEPQFSGERFQILGRKVPRTDINELKFYFNVPKPERNGGRFEGNGRRFGRKRRWYGRKAPKTERKAIKTERKAIKTERKAIKKEKA